MESKRKKRRLWTWIALLLLATLLAYNYWPAPIKLILSRETTYITTPLNPDGTPDYVAYLDANWAESVIPEDNAAPLLLMAMGPKALESWIGDCPGEDKNEILGRLKLSEEALDAGPHFVTWDDYQLEAQAVAKGVDPSQYQEDASYDGPDIDHVYSGLLAGKVHPDLEAWLARNSAPLKLILRAADKKMLYVPMVSDTDMIFTNDLIGRAWEWRFIEATNALTSRAVLRMRHNAPLSAWDDVLAVHRLARLRNRGPRLKSKFAAIEMNERAARTGIWLATEGRTPTPNMKEVLSKLLAIEPVGGTIEAFEHAERLAMLKWAMDVYRTKASGLADMPEETDLDWNRMLRRINSQYDHVTRLLEEFRQQDGERSALASWKFLCESQETLDMPPSKSHVKKWLLDHGGKLLRTSRTDWVTNAMILKADRPTPLWFDWEDKANVALEIETLAVALACYHEENGRWPTELKELSPSMMKTIPIDRFSGTPLVYRVMENGYLLYSVGENRQDDGGNGPPRNSRKDDIVAQIGPAQTSPPPAAARL